MAKPPKPPQAVNPVSPELAAPAPEAPAPEAPAPEAPAPEAPAPEAPAPEAPAPEAPAPEAPAPEAPAAPTGSIFRNPQQGVVNVLDVVFDAGATVTLTEEQLNNEQIMRRVNHAVNIGVLTAV